MSELRTNRIIPRDGLVSGTHNGGGIIQVRQAVHSEYVVYTANSFSAGALANGSTGNYSITITPTRADSKILVSFNSMYDSYSGQRNYVTIFRSIAGGTASNVLTGSGASRGLVEIWNNDHRIQSTCAGQYLDSPSTTSACLLYTSPSPRDNR